ncbi:hypothetical protein MUP77_20610 [Candidatus Bathyarchaeota archaeon]|nr:hypothetical protein [Candidatus Bathyarchaeota archaeon]
MVVHHVRSWEEFKALALNHKPDTVFYLAQPHLFRTPPLGLRLTFYHGQDMYVMTDYAKGASLVKTGIQITSPEDKVQAQVREQDIRDFLSRNFPWTELVSLPPFMYGQFM